MTWSPPFLKQAEPSGVYQVQPTLAVLVVPCLLGHHDRGEDPTMPLGKPTFPETLAPPEAALGSGQDQLSILGIRSHLTRPGRKEVCVMLDLGCL